MNWPSLYLLTGLNERRTGLLRYWEPHFYIFGIFLVFVVARYMQWGARRDIFATIRLEFLLGMFLGIVCVAVISSRESSLRADRNVIIGISLLFLTMLIQLPFAAAPEIAKTIFIDRVVKFAMLTLFMAVLIQSPRGLLFFIGAFLISCFYVTQESVQGLISGGLVWQNQGIMRLHGAVPIYEHPNSLGGLAMGAVPFVVFLLPVIKKWYIRLPLLALLGTSLICVIYSGSRTAYVALVSFILYWWLLSENKKRFLVTALVMIPILLLVVPEEYKERFRSIGGEEEEGQSKQARLRILDDAWQIFLQRPLGVGVASFPAVRYEVFGRRQDTHNLYLEVATNLGAQGFVVFIFLLYALSAAYKRAMNSFSKQVAALRRSAQGKRLPRELRQIYRVHFWDLDFLIAICKAGGGFLFVRLVLGFFGMDLYEVYWWFSAGLALCLTTLAFSTERATRKLVSLSEPSGQDVDLVEVLG